MGISALAYKKIYELVIEEVFNNELTDIQVNEYFRPDNYLIWYERNVGKKGTNFFDKNFRITGVNRDHFWRKAKGYLPDKASVVPIKDHVLIAMLEYIGCGLPVDMLDRFEGKPDKKADFLYNQFCEKYGINKTISDVADTSSVNELMVYSLENQRHRLEDDNQKKPDSTEEQAKSNYYTEKNSVDDYELEGANFITKYFFQIFEMEYSKSENMLSDKFKDQFNDQFGNRSRLFLTNQYGWSTGFQDFRVWLNFNHYPHKVSYYVFYKEHIDLHSPLKKMRMANDVDDREKFAKLFLEFRYTGQLSEEIKKKLLNQFLLERAAAKFLHKNVDVRATTHFNRAKSDILTHFLEVQIRKKFIQEDELEIISISKINDFFSAYYEE